MQKRYKIVVTECGEEVRTVGREWRLGGEGDPEAYGYTPETQATREYSRDVYEQTVDDLDLAALVSVVNKM